jgi:hypothetical protein
MILVRFGKNKYHLCPDTPQVIFDKIMKRMSHEQILKDFSLPVKEAYEILLKIYQSDHKKNQKPHLELNDVVALIHDNLVSRTLPGLKMSLNEINTKLRGVNYGVIRHVDQEKILNLLDRILRASPGWEYRMIRVPYPEIQSIKLGRIANYLRAPLGKTDKAYFETIPLLIPVVSNYLLRAQN